MDFILMNTNEKDWVDMKQQTEDWISRDIDSRLF